MLVRCDSKVILYADDSALLCADKTYEGLKFSNESEIHKVEKSIVTNLLLITLKLTVLCFLNKLNIFLAKISAPELVTE